MTINNDDEENVYKIKTNVDQKFALLEQGLNKNKYEKKYYCLFYESDKLYFYGKGEIDELSEPDEPDETGTLILYGNNLNIENSDEIILLINSTFNEYDNIFFFNGIFGKYIRLKYDSKINSTHYKVKMLNKNDVIYFEKQFALDEKYIIVKNNKKINDNNKKEEKQNNHKYVILGNEKNISLDKPLKIEKESIQIFKSSDKLNFYKIPHNDEFLITFDISNYYTNIKESYVFIIFSNDKKIKHGDYEFLIDLKNKGIIIKKLKEKEKNEEEPLAFTINNINKNPNVFKYGIVFINSTFYLNNYFTDF